MGRWSFVGGGEHIWTVRNAEVKTWIKGIWWDSLTKTIIWGDLDWGRYSCPDEKYWNTMREHIIKWQWHATQWTASNDFKVKLWKHHQISRHLEKQKASFSACLEGFDVLDLEFKLPAWISGLQKLVFCKCSQQLRFVEVDPEEDCRAKGDDENCPAKLQQCVARVASMCNFRDGQHCSGKCSCLGYPIFWHCLHLTSSSFWSGDKCHVGKTKKCQAHSHHQKRRGATSHGECQTAKLQILPLNCSVLSQSCARCNLLICSHGVSQALRGAH